MDWTVIVSAVLGILAVVASGVFLKAKGKLRQVVTLGKEAVDVAIVAVDALEDNAIDKSEVEAIKKEALELKEAWKALLGK
ncbi:unnamed protein product [marine sediment metagenome]|uniref:Uncharacterized protein n=1 Tax=marine sediment metagenome TaxID=412755 RepID=X0UWL3_9ZZZZ